MKPKRNGLTPSVSSKPSPSLSVVAHQVARADTRRSSVSVSAASDPPPQTCSNVQSSSSVPTPRAGEAIEAALGVALDLMHLDQRLAVLAALRLGSVGGIEELQAAAQVRIVRDDHGVAAGAGVQAVVLDRRPDPLRDAAGNRIELAGGKARHVLVAEDDVAMQVAAERAGRVLVADEGRERAGGRCGRRLPRPRPGYPATPTPPPRRSRRRRCGRKATTAAGTGIPAGNSHCDGDAELFAGRVDDAQDLADRLIVDRGAGRRADIDLAEPLRVVGHARRNRAAVRCALGASAPRFRRTLRSLRRARTRTRRAVRHACRRCRRRRNCACGRAGRRSTAAAACRSCRRARVPRCAARERPAPAAAAAAAVRNHHRSRRRLQQRARVSRSANIR